MRQFTFVGSVVLDERQLDGSRHLEIVGEVAGGETALHVVVDHDGDLAEAEMTLELDGAPESVALDGEPDAVDWEDLEFRLTSETVRLEARSRQDGDLDMRLALRGVKP